MSRSTTQQSERSSEKESFDQFDFQTQNDLPDGERVQLLDASTELRQKGDLDDGILAKSEKSVRRLVKIVFICVIALCAVLLVGAYTLNLILAPGSRWLTEDDMSRIKDVVISIVSGLIMSLAISRISK